MSNLDELQLMKEKKNLEDSYKDSLKELRKVSSFLKLFVRVHETTGKKYESEKAKEIEKEKELEQIEPLKSTNSNLFKSINNIYESFQTLMKNSQSLISGMTNDLVKPLDDFIQNQLTFYNQNLKEIKTINSNCQSYKAVLDNSKNNYYYSSYMSNQLDSEKIDNSILKGEKELTSKKDELIKTKMITRNDEFIYKYENGSYNKNIDKLNIEYDSFLENVLTLEKTKIHFIHSLLDKFKKYLTDYVAMINIYINDINKFNDKEIGEKENLEQTKSFSKFKEESTNNIRIPKIEIMSYQNYCDKIKEKEKIKTEMSNKKRIILNKSIALDEEGKNNFIKEFLNNLVGENEVEPDKISQIFELLSVSIYDIGKKILNYLLEKKGISSLVFANLQNLEHLANILGYISLHQSSIFNGQFDLNFKIIFISERIFYRKKLTNDKIYLNALLSKNKYFRTKQFWRNVLELKLVNILKDHISRFGNLKIKEKKGIFSKIFSSSQKTGFLEKTRILPLIKEYSTLDADQIQLIDKMAVEGMQKIIKDSIPSFANFNFPSEQCLDLIAELSQEYKITKENINFYVTYFNVSSYTIRKIIPNEKGNTINIYKQFQKLSDIQKKLKLFRNIVPFLSYTDYNNLLLCSKLFHKKLSKIIYKYILKQKNLSNKIRLAIWHNLLGISSLQKKYNYKDILEKSYDEKIKHEIELDVVRTTVGNVQDPNKARKDITNILMAVSFLNGKIKYCQGMNFVVQLLYELFGEEEAFFIFLSFFINTEYHLIFEKDLKELKIMFYVFKRVISLLEPELSSYFNSNGVDVNFFVSPWFITLFTSSHQNNKDENDNSQILIRILDNFIVSGLKSIMEVGCVALHSYENELMSKRYEEVMQFLINDMLRSDFFSKKNTEFIENFFTETKISKNLVKNIEEEFAQEQKLNKFLNKK